MMSDEQGPSRARVGGPEIDLGVESMTDKQQVADALTEEKVPFFVRQRTFGLMDEVGLTVDQAVAVAKRMTQTYRNGVDSGEYRSLYAHIPEGWPRIAGRPVHLHKVWDMLVMEFEVKDQPGEYRYCAQAGRDNWWAKDREDMHAAIADALGFKHDGNMSTAGEYIIRMLGIEE